MNVPASFLLTLRRFDRALTSRVDRIRAQAASIDAEYERRERAAYVALRSVQYRDAMEQNELMALMPESAMEKQARS